MRLSLACVKQMTSFSLVAARLCTAMMCNLICTYSPQHIYLCPTCPCVHFLQTGNKAFIYPLRIILFIRFRTYSRLFHGPLMYATLLYMVSVVSWHVYPRHSSSKSIHTQNITMCYETPTIPFISLPIHPDAHQPTHPSTIHPTAARFQNWIWNRLLFCFVFFNKIFVFKFHSGIFFPLNNCSNCKALRSGSWASQFGSGSYRPFSVFFRLLFP